MPYDDTYIRQMLMGGQPTPQAPPDVSAMVDATQQQGNPQMPQMMPQLQQQQPMSPQPDQSETRKPGFVKGMLMDFTGTLREALQKEMGVETDEEKKVREFKMRLQTDAAQLAVQKYKQDQELQTAQMQHADAQSRRADAELQLHKATLAAQLQQKSDAENAGEKLTGEFKAREKQAKSMGLAGQDYVNFVANRDVQKTATDKNPTEASILMDAAGGSKQAQAALKLKTAQVMAGRAPKDTSAADARRVDLSVNKNTASIDKLQAPIDTLNMRMDRLKATLDQPNMLTDALAPPELMTVMAGGMGSGLRLNEAEIARVVGGRTQWESLKSQLQKWSLNPGQAVSIQPSQRGQMKALIGEVERQMSSKADMLNNARDAIANSANPDEHKRIYSKLRRDFSASPSTPASAPGGWGSILKNSKKVGGP